MARCSTVCALALAVVAGAAGSAAAQPGVQVGMLECRGAGTVSFVIGSEHRLRCLFRSDTGGTYPYYGVVRRMGLDVGFTAQSVLAWSVFAPSQDIGPAGLAGGYGGVTAGAAVGVGANANALVGGSGNSFTLQPVSLEGQTGLNVAVGVASLDLTPAGPVLAPRGHFHRHMHHARVHHHRVHH